MATPRTFLVTGANRGIGKGLVAILLRRSSTTVVATVRDPAGAAPVFSAMPRAESSRLIIVGLDSGEENGAADAVKQLRADHGIDHLDVVIANAAVNDHPGPVAENSAQSMVHHYKVNTVGPVTLFQATKTLLQASRTGNPTFVAVTSGLGSIFGMDRLSGFESVWSPYGATKAALNWFMRRIHFDEPWLTTFVINPGVVKTDMMAGVGPLVENPELFGAITVETSATNILRVVDAASREISGTFKDHDGSDLPW